MHGLQGDRSAGRNIAADRATASPAGDAAEGLTTCLIVPGLGGSGRTHWQSRWERDRADWCRPGSVDWESPSRAAWVAAVDRAVEAAPGGIAIVAHSLGCLAVAWWASTAAGSLTRKVTGAMLVAPPDVGQQGADLRLLRFSPAPAAVLPFPSLVVASTDDRFCSIARARALAAGWGSDFHDAGARGHLNAESGLGDWPEGRALLAGLVREGRRSTPTPTRA